MPLYFQVQKKMVQSFRNLMLKSGRSLHSLPSVALSLFPYVFRVTFTHTHATLISRVYHHRSSNMSTIRSESLSGFRRKLFRFFVRNTFYVSVHAVGRNKKTKKRKKEKQKRLSVSCNSQAQWTVNKIISTLPNSSDCQFIWRNIRELTPLKRLHGFTVSLYKNVYM